MLGYWHSFHLWQTLILCALGGFLGVLFTIPLRRAMVVETDLPYPEGCAAAEILKAGSVSAKDEKKGADSVSGLKEISVGFGISSIFSLFSSGFHIFSSGFSTWFALGGGAVSGIGVGFSTALISAGYLIGISSGIAIFVGWFIAWGSFVPYFTSTAQTISEGMSLGDFASSIWVSKVRLIGVGVIGIAAIWTLLAFAKPVIRGMSEAFAVSRNQKLPSERVKHHTDLDLSAKSFITVLLISLIGLFIVFYTFVADANLSVGVTLLFAAVGIILAVLIGFLVASACGYMAGLLGSSSSPISGITILGVIAASLTVYGLSELFDVFELQNGARFATAYAIFITSVITAVACISNDNMQDLKTGYLIGATPWRQQTALLIGCVTGAIAIAPVLNLMYEAYGFTGAMPRADMDPAAVLSAPQATLMSTLAQGIFKSSLDWSLIFLGVAIGVVCIIVHRAVAKIKQGWALPPLAVGFGIYLPSSICIALMFGAILSYLVGRYVKAHASDEGKKRSAHVGVLFASGMIVGESIIGVLIALAVVISVSAGGSSDPLGLVGADFASVADVLGIVAFLAVIALFVKRTISAANQ